MGHNKGKAFLRKWRDEAMSNQSNGGRQGRDDNDNIASWIFTVVMLAAFFPVGAILLAFKLWELFRRFAKPANPAVRRPRGADGRWLPMQPMQRRGAPAPRQASPAKAEPAAFEQAGGKRPGRPARGWRKLAGRWMYAAAGAGLLAFGVSKMLEPLEWLIRLGFDSYDLREALQWGVVAAGGACMLGVAAHRRRRERRYAAYLPVIGDSRCLSLDFVASATGRRYAVVVDDLQRMIGAGYFGQESYLDLAERCFVACHAAAPRRGVRREEAPAPAQTVLPGRYAEEEQLCSLNKTIGNPHVTECMNRLEELTHKILAYVEEHPEKESRIRRFRAHYLPKTLKICQAYARFEQQGVQGENIRSAMQEVEEVMDSLVRGFENQLDRLFDDEALDLSSDISVLENMMAPAELKIEDYMPETEKMQ